MSPAERAGYFNRNLTRHVDWTANQPDAAVFLFKRQSTMITKAAQQSLTSYTAKPHRLTLTLNYAAISLTTLLQILEWLTAPPPERHMLK